MAVRVDKEQFAEKVLGADGLVMVEFYSDSCIPCKQMSPIIGGIEDDYEGKLQVYKVNINFDAELAETYAVMASPTILFFQNGKETARLRGLAKRDAIEDIVKQLL